MSEYQYYEFVAIDRPLTKKEVAELRACSSRAMITSTGFVNDYQWGDLKADPADWMERYFDAFVYTANWCSCRFALRLPHEAFSKAQLKSFTSGFSLTADHAGTHWIMTWSLNEGQNYDRFDQETGQGWMGRLIPLRDELLRGDLRPLYLGWLAGVSAGEVDDDMVEPEVPPGLSTLSAAQQALVEFLEIDVDLVEAASAASPPDWQDDDSVEVWVEELARHDIHYVLNLLLLGASHQAERWAKSSFRTWQKASGSSEPLSLPLRQVAALRAMAEKANKLRQEQEAIEYARHEAKQRKQREAYLRQLLINAEQHWKTIDQLAERGTASGYEAAKCAIVDLADAYAFTSDQNTFDKALQRFMVRHSKRAALVRRLVEVGLWKK